MEQLLNPNPDAVVALDVLALNLALTIALSTLVAWFYAHFGKSLSNRTRFAYNLPPLAMTTVLIISVVQSSLALSLGLVGALSIIRFRTAIKEPEELVHLFLAVAIGLGAGANQPLPTIVTTLVILGFLYVRSRVAPGRQHNNMFFSVATGSEDASFERIHAIVQRHAAAAELRRLDTTSLSLNATYLLAVSDVNAIVPLMDALRAEFPGCDLNFVEQDDLLTA